MLKKHLLVCVALFLCIFVKAQIKIIRLCPGVDTLITAPQLPNSTYQWQLKTVYNLNFHNLVDNSTNLGVHNDTLLIPLAATFLNGNLYRCIITNANGNTISDTTRLSFRSTWTGLNSNDWFNPGNWDCGGVPDMFTDVRIPVGNPVITGNANCRSIVVTTPANLHLADSAHFFVSDSNAVNPNTPATIPLLVSHGLWKAYEGSLGEAELFVIDYYNDAYPPCPNLADHYDVFDSIHIFFNANLTGGLSGYSREWGQEQIGASCDYVDFYRYNQGTIDFTWELVPESNIVRITFIGGLLDPNEGPLDFHILTLTTNTLYLYGVIQPEPDILYFDLKFH